VDSRADIIFKGAERARPIMVDVTSISGLSKIVNLRQYKVGGTAHIAEERKVKEYSKLWDIEDTTRASLHFFGVELTGCMTRGHQFVQTDVEFDRGRTCRFEENIRVVFHWIPEQQSGKIGFYDEGGLESRTGARCEDGDRTRVEIRVEKYLGSDSS
jgi:hypothetical protein